MLVSWLSWLLWPLYFEWRSRKTYYFSQVSDCQYGSKRMIMTASQLAFLGQHCNRQYFYSVLYMPVYAMHCSVINFQRHPNRIKQCTCFAAQHTECCLCYKYKNSAGSVFSLLWCTDNPFKGTQQTAGCEWALKEHVCFFSFVFFLNVNTILLLYKCTNLLYYTN